MFLPALMLLVLVGGMLTSCRFATSYKDGDTIAASEFEPADTSLASNLSKDTLKRVAQAVVDSTDIFYVGTGSTKQFLQLVSYPSKRDTLVYGKTLHIKVKGSADFNNVVRVRFYLLNVKIRL